jgi:hypothetical protein
MIKISSHKDILRRIFADMKTIAVVGLSPKENRPSNMVARYLMDAGYTIIPVNPGQEQILGLKCYPDLSAINQQVDVVDIFRRSDQVEPIVAEAISIGAKAVWMQEGVVNEQAASLAEKAGLKVIMDHCLKIELQNFKP